MKRLLSSLTAVIASIGAMQSSEAHFPWLTVGGEGNAIYYFGETPDDRTYKLPPSIAKAEVKLIAAEGKPENVELTAVENDDFIGMKSTRSIAMDAWLASKVTYGVYHGSRLDYYTQHLGGKLPTSRNGFERLAKHLDLHAQVIDTDSGVDVFVLWKGEPLPGAQVRLFCEEGHEEGSAKTDESGKVSFDDKQVEEGLNGIVVGHTVQGNAGTFDQVEYDSVSQYLTVTFSDPQDFETASLTPSTSTVGATDDSKVDVSGDLYPPIPEMVTSFGAAVSDDAVYVYGGHMGRAHEYYAEAQANTLWRLDLKNPKSWESLGDGPGLQGLAMVAHDHKLYRIGGFIATNQDGEPKDLRSQANVACYDLSTKQWQELPPLPEPRSSFDAAVLGDRIYVIGGWNLQGDETTWLPSACVLDLSSKPLRWQTLPEPPFQRRALSVAAHQGKLYAIGGMQPSGGPSTRVDVYDPDSQTWSLGPDLNGEGMDGFGSSSFAVGGDLYVSTYSGTLQRLSGDGKAWETLCTLERDRFFHRLLPLSDKRLLAIGGASMSAGKFEELDVISIR